MPLLDPSELENELSSVSPSVDMVAGSAPFPYLGLSAEDFERLGYALFAAEAKAGQGCEWTSATLMLRGSDAGRDVALFREERLVGVVQCKRVESSMTLPAVFRELAKTVLFPFADATLPKIEPGLRYVLMISRDPAGTVVDFFDRTGEILEAKKDIIANAVLEVLEAYQTLGTAFPDAQPAIDLVTQALPTLTYHLMRPHALDLRLHATPAVASMFFAQRTVIDNSVVQPFFEQIAAAMAGLVKQTEGVPLLTDADLRILKDRIENMPQSHRLNLGFAATFGLPREMFISEAALEKRGKRIVELTQEIGKDLNDWLFDRAYSTADALALHHATRVHPFACQAARGFLGIVARDALQKQMVSGKMAELAGKIFGFTPYKDDDERLDATRARLLDQGRRYLAGDSSKLEGDPELVSLKKHMLDLLMEGIRDEETLERHLTLGIGILQPPLVEAAEELRRLGEQPVTIVVTGLDALGSRDVLNRLADTARALERRGRPQPGEDSKGP